MVSGPGTGIGRRPPWLRHHWRTVTALVVLIVAGGAWLTHSRLLIDFGAGVRQETTVTVGDAVYADALIFPLSDTTDAVDINLRSIEPRIVENSAGATVDILVCSASDVGRMTIASGDFREYCTSGRVWQPGVIGLGQEANTYLLYAVTGYQPGTVRIDGADVSFRKDVRWGSQRVGGTISIDVMGQPGGADPGGF